MASIPSAVLPKSVLATDRHKAAAIRVSPLVVESATMDTAGVYAKLNSRADGLRACFENAIFISTPSV
jgi:hypothetical protein